jgi:hypothetical protein
LILSDDGDECPRQRAVDGWQEQQQATKEVMDFAWQVCFVAAAEMEGNNYYTDWLSYYTH